MGESVDLARLGMGCSELFPIWVDDKNLHEFQHHPPRSSCKRVDALIGLFPTPATR